MQVEYVDSILFFDKETNKMSNLKSNVIKKVEENEFTWNELITGLITRKLKTIILTIMKCLN